MGQNLEQIKFANLRDLNVTYVQLSYIHILVYCDINERGILMDKRLKDALKVALVTFVVSVILLPILFGEIKWIVLISIVLIIFVGKLLILPKSKRM